MRPTCPTSAPSLNHGAAGGHTLIELLVALAILALLAAAPLPSMVRALEYRTSRDLAYLTQGCLLSAQWAALWSAEGAAVQVGRGAVRIERPGAPSGDLLVSSVSAASGGVPLTANVARWNVTDGVKVRFAPASGAPDSGGSIFMGEGPASVRLVIRPGSGLTRIEAR